MTTTQIGSLPVHRWVRTLLGPTHLTVIVTITWAVLCLLAAQHITPAALARALPSERAGSGRSSLRRVRRWWTGPPLDQVLVSPALIRRALALLPAGQAVVVALDTTRLGPWEVWLAGVVVAGRTVPIGWAVLPYPWPKGQFHLTTVALLQRLQPPSRRASLDARRGTGFAECTALCPLSTPETGFMCGSADGIGDCGWGLCDGSAHVEADAGEGHAVPATMGRGTPAQPWWRARDCRHAP